MCRGELDVEGEHGGLGPEPDKDHVRFHDSRGRGQSPHGGKRLLCRCLDGQEVFFFGGDEVDKNPLAWQKRALYAQTNPEAFFPEKGGSTREAKRVCATCEVREECLQYALANDERFGIWGGLSERERRKLKRRAV